MKVILKKNFKKLGFKKNEVKVKPGYARNYLIPNGYAILTKKNIIKNKFLKIDDNKKNKKFNNVKMKINEKLLYYIINKKLKIFFQKKNIKLNKKLINIITNPIKKLGIFFLNKKIQIKFEIYSILKK
jgi:large subunit ribosomal protein L9